MLKGIKISYKKKNALALLLLIFVVFFVAMVVIYFKKGNLSPAGSEVSMCSIEELNTVEDWSYQGQPSTKEVQRIMNIAQNKKGSTKDLNCTYIRTIYAIAISDHVQAEDNLKRLKSMDSSRLKNIPRNVDRLEQEVSTINKTLDNGVVIMAEGIKE